MKVKTELFDLAEFLDFAKNNPNMVESDQRGRGALKFSGTSSFDDALKIVQEGFALDSVSNLLDEINAESNSQEEHMQYDVAGAYVDVGVYLSGDPENMVDFVIQEGRDHLLNVVITTAESHKITTKQIERRAAVIASLVDSLEDNGIRCSIILIDALRHPKHRTSHYNIITVKEYDQPLELSRITGVLHPSFLRRIEFSFIEQTYPRSVWDSYGRVITDRNELMEQVNLSFPNEKSFLINSVTSQEFRYKTHTDVKFNTWSLSDEALTLLRQDQ